MPKTTLKLYAIVATLAVVTFFLSASNGFVSNADSDEIINEIAGYKNWARISEQPIKVSFPHLVKDSNFKIDGDGGG